MMNKRFLYLLFGLFIYSSCQNRPYADYYEVDGIISIHAGTSSPQNNWKEVPFHTSVPMISAEDTSATEGTLSFTFYIDHPGDYSLWVMSGQFSSDPALNFLPIRIEDDEGFLMKAYRLKLNDYPVLEWLNENYEDEEPIMIQFPDAGHYTVRFESRGEPGYIVDRIHLSHNNQRPPDGMGLPETQTPHEDPLLAKRDQPVVLPPEWVFGMIYNETDDSPETTELINRLEHENLPVDGFGIKARTEANNFDQLLELLSNKNIRWGVSAEELTPADTPDFLYPKGNAGPDKIRQDYEATQSSTENSVNRGFVLAGLNGLNEPEFKEYPTRRIETVPEWNQPESSEAGLKEAIEHAANPRLSTYEIPFLAFEAGDMRDQEIHEVSEELLIRWLQFAAFTPVMTIGAGSLDDLSGTGTQQLRDLAHLRNRLFPYIYSQAHRVRATGERPVTGDGIHKDQYLFGEAFLVAPVYEPDSEQRRVYFPEGTWYDYWNGTSYEGNQNWFVETGLDKIPVFVKAGSIIPYREFSVNNSEGTNQQLLVEVYTGGVGTFRLYEDDGKTMNYREGEFATTAFRYFEQGDNYSTFTIGAVVGSFDGQVSDKQYTILFKYAEEPSEIEVNGTVLNQGTSEGEWFYDSDEQMVVLNWNQPDREKTDFVIRW